MSVTNMPETIKTMQAAKVPTNKPIRQQETCLERCCVKNQKNWLIFIPNSKNTKLIKCGIFYTTHKITAVL